MPPRRSRGRNPTAPRPFSERRAAPHAATSCGAGPLQLGANSQVPSEEHRKKRTYCLLFYSAHREIFIAALTHRNMAPNREKKNAAEKIEVQRREESAPASQETALAAAMRSHAVTSHMNMSS